MNYYLKLHSPEMNLQTISIYLTVRIESTFLGRGGFLIHRSLLICVQVNRAVDYMTLFTAVHGCGLLFFFFKRRGKKDTDKKIAEHSPCLLIISQQPHKTPAFQKVQLQWELTLHSFCVHVIHLHISY